MNLLNEIQRNYSCDKNRIYVMGLSMGGYATWTLLENYPDVFAAGVPICGWGNVYNAHLLVDIPIRIYHGRNDTTVSFSQSQAMYDAIIECGGKKVIFTKLSGYGHNVWEYAAYDDEMHEWLFSQSLKKR